jgi:cytochrome P450
MGAATYRIHGPFGSSAIMTSQPENAQAMFATQFHDFEIPNFRKTMFLEMMGNGIFTAGGKEWAHYRHMVKPQFTRTQVEELGCAARHLDILFKSLPYQNPEGWIEEVDLMPFLYRFTMDTTTEFLFGESVNSQSRNLHAEGSNNRKQFFFPFSSEAT